LEVQPACSATSSNWWREECRPKLRDQSGVVKTRAREKSQGPAVLYTGTSAVIGGRQANNPNGLSSPSKAQRDIHLGVRGFKPEIAKCLSRCGITIILPHLPLQTLSKVIGLPMIRHHTRRKIEVRTQTVEDPTVIQCPSYCVRLGNRRN
jgi:hypothetical protein